MLWISTIYNDCHYYYNSENAFRKRCKQRNPLLTTLMQAEREMRETKRMSTTPNKRHILRTLQHLLQWRVYRRQCFATNCCDGKYNLKSKIGYISWLMAFQFKFEKYVHSCKVVALILTSDFLIGSKASRVNFGSTFFGEWKVAHVKIQCSDSFIISLLNPC